MYTSGQLLSVCVKQNSYVKLEKKNVMDFVENSNYFGGIFDNQTITNINIK